VAVARKPDEEPRLRIAAGFDEERLQRLNQFAAFQVFPDDGVKAMAFQLSRHRLGIGDRVVEVRPAIAVFIIADQQRI